MSATTSLAEQTFSGEKITVIGMGYVGCVTAACLAQLGHIVVGVDPDLHKVEAVRESRSPFYEPGLDAIVTEAVSSGCLSASQALAPALAQSAVALICVGTPSGPDGNLSLTQLRHVASEIGELVKNRIEPLIVVIRSTVFPGTCEMVAELIGCPEIVSVVSNPEFLREGSAVQDFRTPSLLVVGGKNHSAVARVAGLYKSLPVEPSLVSLETAELIKYACNAFHALKIGFANEIGTLAAHLGIDGNEVMATLCRDRGLNISTAYLKPGFAFGGSCLPKDLRALSYQADRLNLDLPLLNSILPGNERHLERALIAMDALPSQRLGILGLAFKENTDDLRESPVLKLVQHLIAQGRDIRIWDPHIRIEQIYGSNLRYLLDAVPGIDKLMAASSDDVLSWANHLVVAQKPSAQVSAAIQASGLPVLDLAGRVPAPLKRN
ncbi:MAG: nucleotide sugar dehydrogenase [Bryobacteraceae bacterium]